MSLVLWGPQREGEGVGQDDTGFSKKGQEAMNPAAYVSKRKTLVLGCGRSPGKGHGNPLQYSSLEDSVARGALSDIVHGATYKKDVNDPDNHDGVISDLEPAPNDIVCLLKYTHKHIPTEY